MGETGGPMAENGIEPELDDVVERSFGYQMLSSSRQMSELLVGFLMPGAIEPPKRPSRRRDLDPARVLDEAQEQQRRRLEQISPAAGRHYVGMWQAVTEASQRVTPVADTFNNAREMISALTEVLRAVAGVDVKFLDDPDLGVPDDANEQLTTLISDLASVVTASRRLHLHKVTHRNGVGEPRPMTTELIDRARSAEQIAERFADLYEKNIDIVHAEIDRLLAVAATKEGASRLASLAAPDHAAVQSFFDRLDDPGWWSVLRGKKFFDEPPEPPEDFIHPRWPQSRYLARIASRVDNPAELADLLVQIGCRTCNVRVREDVLRAAAQLPPECSVRVLASEQSWATLPLQRRVARLATGGEIIRYPAWRAGLLAHVAAHPDSAPAAQRDAERSLRAALRVRMELADAESIPEFVADEMDAASVSHVLLHLREHSNVDERTLVTGVVAKNVEDISEELIQWMQGEDVNEQDDPSLTDVLRWYLDAGGGCRSDRSHLVIHPWPGGPSNEQVEALEGLMRGLSGLLAITLARGGRTPDALRSHGTTNARRTVGLLDRAQLAALLLIEPPPGESAEKLLTTPELAHAAVVRGEYTQLLERAWPVLRPEARQQIRTVLAVETASGTVAELIESAPLMGLEDHTSEDALLRRASTVTDDPAALLAIARGRLELSSRSGARDDIGDQDPESTIGRRVQEDIEEWEHPSAHADRVDPLASRRAQERSRLEQLRARDCVPSADDWAEVLDVVAPPRLVLWTGAPSSGLGSARWISLLVDWVAQHDLPDGAIRRRLQQFTLHRRWSWATAPEPSRAEQMAHHGLDLAQSSAHAQVLVLKICALLRQHDRDRALTEKQRRKIIRSLRADLASSSPLRPTLMTVIGQLLPLIHAGAEDVWDECIAPLIQELPELAAVEEGPLRAPGLPPHARDLAALYSGLIMSRARMSPRFTDDTLRFLTWCYENLSALQIPSGIVPSPLVTHAHAVITTELLYMGGPGPVLRAILDSAPTLLSVGALRLFSEPEFTDAPEELGANLRRLWTAISDWADDHPERGDDVLATIGTWIANSGLATLLGPDWALSRIEEVLQSRAALDVSNELFESFSVLAGRTPEFAERIVNVVLSMRRKGLLMSGYGRGLGQLIAALTALAVWPAHLAELRSALLSDRLLGPPTGH